MAPAPREDDLIPLASYLAIEACQDRFENPPRGLYFNKVLSLLHRQFQDLGVDIGLPHCWYRYGDEVVRYEMPSPLVWDHEATDKTTVLWDGDPPPRARHQASRSPEAGAQ